VSTDLRPVEHAPGDFAAQARVLIVDDLDANRRLLTRLLEQDGYIVRAAASGDEAIRLVGMEPPDLILLDVMMPGADGYQVCRHLKEEARTRLIPVVLITALQDSDHRIRGIDAGADDFISKPFNPHELRARVRSLIRLKRYTDDLDSAESVIMSLALTIEARDAYTEGHCNRLAAYAATLGRAIGLGSSEITALQRGGVLHDIGKVGIPDAILMKPGRLTAAEYALMKDHTIIGDRLCAKLRVLQDVRPIVRHHHERLDGSGYPDGLKGSDIPLLAQITGIVDVFDALTTIRPYRQAESREAALEELAREARAGLHQTDLVNVLVRLHEAGDLPALKTEKGVA
jgi:putative two-component system response regulator